VDVRKSASRRVALLELDLRASGFELLLDLFGVGLGSGLLDGLRSALDKVLGLLETQAGDGADFLDDADLVRAGILQDDVELGLLLGRSGGGSSASGRGRGNGNRSGGGNAPLLFEVLDQTRDLEDRLGGQPLDDLFLGDVVAHDDLLSPTSGFRPEARLRDVSPSWCRLMVGLSAARGAFEKGMWDLMKRTGSGESGRSR